MLGHFIPCVDIVINSHTLSSDIPRRDFISKDQHSVFADPQSSTRLRPVTKRKRDSITLNHRKVTLITGQSTKPH